MQLIWRSIVNATKNKLTVAKLNFFAFGAGKMKPFLTYYQGDEPLIPFLHDDLLEVIKSLMTIVFKPDCIKKILTLSDFKKLVLRKDDHFLKRSQYDVGVGASKQAKTLLRNDYIRPNDEKIFRSGCKYFVMGTLLKYQEKIPLHSLVVRCSTALNPQFLVNSKTRLA